MASHGVLTLSFGPFLWTEAGRGFCLGGRAGCCISPQAPPGCSGQGVVSAAQGVPSLRGAGTGGAAVVDDDEVAPGHDGAGWVGGGISLRKRATIWQPVPDKS
jgi:hypothetical protein